MDCKPCSRDFGIKIMPEALMNILQALAAIQHAY